MTCIKMGSDESHFNVSLIVRDSHKTVSTNHNFWRERRAEAVLNWGPSAYQPTDLPLGQTGSLSSILSQRSTFVAPFSSHSFEKQAWEQGVGTGGGGEKVDKQLKEYSFPIRLHPEVAGGIHRFADWKINMQQLLARSLWYTLLTPH